MNRLISSRLFRDNETFVRKSSGPGKGISDFEIILQYRGQNSMHFRIYCTETLTTSDVEAGLVLQNIKENYRPEVTLWKSKKMVF